jgi:hypothetical protein
MLEWEEFRTFLIIYLANADLEFSAAESDYIKKRSNENTYLKQLNAFTGFSDLQAFNFILEHKSLYFDTEAMKSVLLEDI